MQLKWINETGTAFTVLSFNDTSEETERGGERDFCCCHILYCLLISLLKLWISLVIAAHAKTVSTMNMQQCNTEKVNQPRNTVTTVIQTDLL